MARTPGLAPEQLRALGELKAAGGLEQFHLAGGGAVAFHLEHRSSLDIDLFSDEPGTDLDALRARLIEALPGAEVVSQSDATLKLRVNDTAVDIVSYPYPLLTPALPGPAGFPVAGLVDLGVMKLSAISRRGLARDFWDLHAILHAGHTLAELAAAYRTRYGRAEADLYHVVRALTYFDDADRDASRPDGLDDALWRRIKEFFEAEAPRLLRP